MTEHAVIPMSAVDPPETIKPPRNITVEQAVHEILGLLRRSRGCKLYYSAIAKELNLCLSIVIEACREIVKRAKP